eukprot:m.40761 g.40761  ORF g.40761 m.40761 type:complete len:236 (-) comp9706_c0_seq2:847-1554(-)
MAEGLVTQVTREEKTKDTFNGSKWSCCACFESKRKDEERSQTDHVVSQPQSLMPQTGRTLLPTVDSNSHKKKCLVLDLDETLVHSSFKPVSNADYVVPIEIDGVEHQVFVLKRPHVDRFLERMGELFEVVLFTASLAKYADPVTDLLDPSRVCKYRLFRESCVFYRGFYVKDLSLLGRSLKETLIVDNSPNSYLFHPKNAVPITSWFDDKNDRELLDLIPFLENVAKSDNVLEVL